MYCYHYYCYHLLHQCCLRLVLVLVPPLLPEVEVAVVVEAEGDASNRTRLGQGLRSASGQRHCGSAGCGLEQHCNWALLTPPRPVAWGGSSRAG